MKIRNAVTAMVALAVSSFSWTAELTLPAQRVDIVASGQESTLIVESSRPFADAAMKVSEGYKLFVTYEDPRYEYSNDLLDVTVLTRRDSSEYKSPQRIPKIFIPAPTKLRFDVTRIRSDPAGVLAALVAQPTATSARFKVVPDGAYTHIVPDSVKRRDGSMANSRSPMEALISIPAGDFGSYELISAICGVIGVANDTNVVLAGHFAFGAAGDVAYRTRFAAHNETARSVLSRALRSIDPSLGQLSWALLYDPSEGIQHYVLNPFVVVPYVPSQAISRLPATRSSGAGAATSKE